MERIHLYDAIREMKAITNKAGAFSFSYRKYDRQRQKGGDLVKVPRARLRSKPLDGVIDHSLYKLFYTDLETDEPRQCWQILIVSFNGLTIYL